MMTVDLALLLAMGVMFAGGIYLVLERTLTRILLGIMLINNGAIMLLFLSSGGTGLAPLFVRGRDPHEYADTLPQALILTAIVIGFAVVAFLTAMIYRSWLLVREDEVEVDAEDVKIARMPAWDAEDDAELVEESSEFLDDAADPNADGYDSFIVTYKETAQNSNGKGRALAWGKAAKAAGVKRFVFSSSEYENCS